MCKISVIMPSLNVASYIGECLDSVIAQTLNDIEIICVDAGSMDGTYEIIQEYANKDSRIKLVSSDKKSYGRQMNIGVEQARGKYIAILETDDFIESNMYEELYEIAERKELDFIKCDHFRLKGEKGKYYRERMRLFTPERRQLYGQVLGNDLPEILSAGMHTWSGIYNRQFLLSNNIWHHESPGASYQDNGFWFQTMMYANRIMFLDRAYYCLRRDNANSSFFGMDKLDIIKKEYDFIRDKVVSCDLPKKRELLNYCYFNRFKNYVGMERLVDDKGFMDYYGMLRADTLDAVKNEEIDFDLFHNRQLKYLNYMLSSGVPIRYESEITDRLPNPDTLKRNVFKERLIKVTDNTSNIYIYGAGIVGKRLYRWMVALELESKIRAFIVSESNGEDLCYGLPIIEIEDFKAKTESMIFIAVGHKLRDEIEKILESKGISNYHYMNSPNLV